MRPKLTSNARKTPEKPLTSRVSQIIPETPPGEVVSREGLESIYRKAAPSKLKTQALKSDPLISKATNKSVEASLSIRMAAYFVDLSITMMCVGMTILGLFLATKAVLDINYQIPTYEFKIYASVLFSIYYFLYFSLLEAAGTTLGRSLFNIKVVNLDNGPIKIKASVMRTFLSFISIALLFLPMALDLHSKISSTKVVKD